MSELVKLLRRREAAERLSVSERTVRRWAASGRLDERKVGPRSVRITEESVACLVRAGAREGQADANREQAGTTQLLPFA